MDVKDYRVLKEKGLVELRGLGNDRVAVEITRFSPTGEMLPVEAEMVNADPDGIAKAIKNAEEQLVAAKAQVADLKEFYGDVETANNAWVEKAASSKKGDEILGKSDKKK